METILWGGLLRAGQAAFAAGPTLLVGLVVAGVFRRLLGPEVTNRAFGGTTWRSIPQAWLWGMLLPVCSLGVIPVAYELRRARLPGGTILAFALTAPLFNPLSLLYGLTLSAPGVIVAFAACSLMVVTLVGFVWDRLFPGSAAGDPLPPPSPPGMKRLAAVALTASRYAAGPTLGYCAIGLVGSVLLSSIYPAGSLTDSMAHTDPYAPLQAVALSIPAYATPLHVMMQVGSMFVHGNSVGAAYVLLSLGAGANLGLLAWAWATLGFRRAAVFLLLFTGSVLAIAYAIEDPLYAGGNVDRPHTHAFDSYSNPFHAGASHGDLAAAAWAKLRESVPLYEVISLTGVGCLTLLGAVCRFLDPAERFEAWLARDTPSAAPGSVMSMQVPGAVLGVVAIAGLVAFSVLGCYVYYPPTNETLQDLKMARADALAAASSHAPEEAVKQIERYDGLSRKLQVGYYLRHGSIDERQRLRAKALRGWLERLKDVIEERDYDRVRYLSFRIFESHRRVAESYSAVQ